MNNSGLFLVPGQRLTDIVIETDEGIQTECPP